jgi:Tfp pilus assembly protein PilN
MRAVNLLPREYPRQRREAPGRELQIAIAFPLVVLVLLAVGWFIAGSRVNGNRSTVQALQAELDSLPKPKTQEPTNPALKAQHEQRVAALSQALEGRLAWDRVLRHISSILPEDVWLTKLSAAPQQVTAPASTAPETTAETATETAPGTTAPAPAPAVASSITQLELDGYTYSQEAVARFLARLSVIPDLTDVELRTSQLTTVGGKQIVSFAVVSTVRQTETAS